ncbi:uncharacterized protein LOC590577 isoform X2 [Strongylocentrotus purpuratus]|uniref:Uncharacterized protein n=1 Tax=Strongylocentrotus purpuratus TaxID=7668 RepID=A0A7M7P324_STRPU|nr:uncharacterized protein LOC590577 isoform X2 [Strongylocentrotus purpuratus]
MTTAPHYMYPVSLLGQAKYLHQFKITSIIHLTSGIALVILGIAAALTRAMWSFYAAPIWCGLFFFIVPGIVGLCAAQQRKHHLTAAYIGLSVMCSVISLGLFIFYWVIIRHEKTLGYVHFTYCNPFHSLEFDCRKSLAGRMVIDVLIALISLMAFIASILGVLFGSCFNCTCCASCFKECYSDAPECCLCCGQRATNEAEDILADGSLRLEVTSSASQPEAPKLPTKAPSGGEPV